MRRSNRGKNRHGSNDNKNDNDIDFAASIGILSALSTMAKPILTLLKNDKVEYNKIFNLLKNTPNEYTYLSKCEKEVELIKANIPQTLKDNGFLKDDHPDNYQLKQLGGKQLSIDRCVK